MRYLVVWAPDWPMHCLDIELPPGSAGAVISRRTILTVNQDARKRGITTSMKLTQARALCPELVELPANPDREAVAFEAILNIFEDNAAHVVCARPGLAWAPASGPARWFAGEQRACEAILEAIVEKTGIECFTGVASGLLAAVEAAKIGAIISDEDTDEFLKTIPLKRALWLLPEKKRQEAHEICHILSDLDVHECAAFIALGKKAIITRFGSVGEDLYRVCSGENIGVTHGERPPCDMTVNVDIDDNMGAATDTFLFPVRRGALELINALAARGFVSDTLTIHMETAGGLVRKRTWKITEPLDAHVIIQRVRWQLKGWEYHLDDPQGEPDGICALTLTAHEPHADSQTTPLWGSGDRIQKIENNAQQIQALLGSEGIVIPHQQGGMSPRERIAFIPWGHADNQLTPQEGQWEGRVAESPTTILDEDVRVELINDNTQHYVHVTDRGMLNTTPTKVIFDPASLGAIHEEALYELLGDTHVLPVRVEQGPWAVTGKWWSLVDEYKRRAYVKVSCADSVCLLLVQRSDGWFIEGIYANE